MPVLRSLVLALFASLVIAGPIAAQTASDGLRKTPARLPSPRLVERVEINQLEGMDVELPSVDDATRRIIELYGTHAEILQAQASYDVERANELFASAMNDLRELSENPELVEQRRFRMLYRMLLQEYESFYGIPDTSLTLPTGTIYALREDVFAAMDRVENPLLEDVDLPGPDPAYTEVPMTQNRTVEQAVTYLLNERQEAIHAWLERADTYFPMIEQILAEEGVPDELKYLSVIESGLNPRARSWAGAVGLWQFMVHTGRLYDLHVTPWVDDRMNPEKATYAAARHLRDLYERYNDWQLALAAYNAGIGRVNGALRRAGYSGSGQPPSYWEIRRYLPRETRNYVPLFIAAALVVSNPEAHGLTTPSRGNRYEYDHVPVQGMLSLSDVARMAGTSESVIRALNPELRRATLPPTDGAYMVRLPRGSYASFWAEYEALPDEAKRPVGEHVVRRGDVLGRIASNYGVTVRQLMQANGLRSTTIHPGQRLIVPVRSYSSTAIADAQPVSVQYGLRQVRPISLPTSQPSRSARAETPVVQASDEGENTPEARAEVSGNDEEPTEASADTEEDAQTRIVYHVRRGDTLGAIARRYNVSVSDLRQWNNISGSTIRAGQQLELYTDGEERPQPVQYTIRRGDTLSQIAARHGVSTRDLRRWNNISGSTIRPGQTLTIHRDGGPDYIVYRVRRGDTLESIARRHGVTIRNLREWNNLSGSLIRPGQRLTIHN